MQTISQAMRIVAKDLKSDKLQIVWTIFFIIYMAAVLSLSINGIFKEQAFLNPFTDFTMIVFSPMLGFIFSRRAFKYFSEDSYTQMLYYYRSVPVPTEAVIVSRAFMGLVSFIVNGVIFFGLIYLFASDLRSSMTLSSYIAFGFTWMGVGILINGVLVYYELLKNGKAFLLISLLFLLLLGSIFLILFMAGLQYNLFNYFFVSSQKWGLLSPVMWCSLLIGLAGYALMCYVTYKRLLHRDLS